MTSSEGFQHHFNIISKFVCCGCYMKKNADFALISFDVLKWHECLSFQLPFELTVEIPVQLHLELEVNLLVCNVIERKIEREKVQMKPPSIHTTFLAYWSWCFGNVSHDSWRKMISWITRIGLNVLKWHFHLTYTMHG